MRKKVVLLAMLVCMLITLTNAERYARWNHAGYFAGISKTMTIMSTEDCSGEKWEIRDNSGVSVLKGTVGASVTSANIHTPMKFNHEIDFSELKTVGNFKFIMVGLKDAPLSINNDPYSSIIQNNLRFLRVYRASSNDVLDRKPAHFGDSSCIIYRHPSAKASDPWKEDAKRKKVNLLGGWYDNYVYTKTTILQTVTVYSLLRAYIANPDIFKKKYSKTDLVDVLDEAKWGLDYLMRLMPDDNEFIISTGGFGDNNRGVLLPSEDDLDGKRECYSYFSLPQMGNTAAALALGSIVFDKAGKKVAAANYKTMAIKVYEAALSKAKGSMWLEEDYDINKDDNGIDNMLLAAIELYKLTGEKSYLKKATEYASEAKNSWWVSYANMHILAYSRALKDDDTFKKYFLADMDNCLEEATKDGNLWGIPQEYSFQSIYANIGIATGAAIWRMESGEKNYDGIAHDVVDYLFGRNNWGRSFISVSTLKNSVRNYYSQIYMLQTRLFPEGGVMIGPVDTETHDSESKWCYFDPRAMPEYKFNTEKLKFFDHSDDYMVVDCYTYGVASNILMLSLYSKMYSGQ